MNDERIHAQMLNIEFSISCKFTLKLWDHNLSDNIFYFEIANFGSRYINGDNSSYYIRLIPFTIYNIGYSVSKKM